jgi:hypothetical protein
MSSSSVGFVSRRVRLFDLKKSELNGVDGEVICFDAPTGRWSVIVTLRDGSEIILRIREENLRRITRVWPQWPPSSRSVCRRADPISAKALGSLSRIPDAVLPNVFRFLDVFTLMQSSSVRYHRFRVCGARFVVFYQFDHAHQFIVSHSRQ